MRRFGLIGRPLGHSASAAYFAEKFAREGIGDCAYALYELPEIEALPRLLAKTPELAGFNVTIPYKRSVMSFLDELSFDARMIGAVNCVRREPDGRLTGHNTDIVGLRASLDLLLGDESPAEAIVLGTGGASQAVQYALAERGIPFSLVSRDASRGNYTYDNLPCEVVERSMLIVNATPVGTFPAVDEAPRIPYGYLTPEHRLFDLIYNPPLTRFLDYGRQRGARIMNGEKMFRLQAEAAWCTWNYLT
ncbi:MAG: shikimate dehydrogenase [Alistipes sp.]|nr:shikimate dehydrogenase [Alistipes senegalensis]MCM1250419.1 shikimate dehydrogenase [Alistipes sp.]